MGLAGELTTIGLAEVFQNLAFNHLTGTLTLKDADCKRRICLENGKVRAIDQELDFVAIARRAEAAPAEALDKAGASKRRRTLRAFLTASGVFDEARYDAAVADQILETILPLFGWHTASFVFEEGKVAPRIFGKEQLDCNVELDPMSIAMEAARRHDEWETIKSYVPSDRDTLILAFGRPDGELAPAVEHTLALLDGTRDIATVIKECPLKKYDAQKTIAEYVEAGWIVPATAERLKDLAGKAQTASKVNLAARRLEIALELEPDDLEARRMLVRLYERAGRKSDAAREQLKLAQTQAERGDSEGALESFERARVLAPADLDVLEQIFKLHEARGERALAFRAGRRLAEALVAQEMYEDALPLYDRLLAVQDRNAGLHEAIAHVYVKLDEPAKACEHLHEIAERAYSANEFDAALKFYRRIVTIDPDHSDAHDRVQEIKTGRAKSRQVVRRRRKYTAVWALAAGLLLWLGAREWNAIEGLHSAQHASLVRADPSYRGRLQAMTRYAGVVADHPVTRSARFAQETVRALLLAEVARVEKLLERAPTADTTSDIELTFGMAKRIVAGLDKIEFPEAEQEFWNSARERIQREITRLEQS